MRVFSVEMLVKEEGAAVVEAALKRLKGEAAAVAAEMKVTTGAVTTTGKAMQAAGTGTQIAGDRAAKAAIGFAAVGQSMARTGSLTADAGTRIIEAGSQIAMMFGPGGLVASALLAAAAGIATYFFNAKKEIADTKKKLDELTDVGNLQGLQNELDKLVLGTASQRGRDAIAAQAAELSKLEAQYGYVAQKLSSELTPAEREAREKMRELREEITTKRDRIADLQNRLKLAADAQRYHTTIVDQAKAATEAAAEADRKAKDALKAYNDELERAVKRNMEVRGAIQAREAATTGRAPSIVGQTRFGTGLEAGAAERMGQPAKPIIDVAAIERDVLGGVANVAGILAAADIDQQLLRAMQIDGLKDDLSKSISDSIEGGMLSGIEMALASGSIGEGFKAMGQAIVRALASAMAKVAYAAIGLGTLLAKIQKFMMANPLLAVASAVALLTLARSMGGGASGADMVATGGPGGLSYAPVGASAPSQQIIFGATSATTAAGMTPRSATNVTIIGPNDPSAQRAMQELLAKANSRGKVG